MRLVDQQTEALEAWEHRLRLAEEDLLEREREALASEPSPSERLAFAAEHDKIARDRDSIATSYDQQANGRDRIGLGRDVAGSGRDRRARALQRDRDPAVGDRWHAGADRDFGAGDRGDSYDDRARSSQARERAADDRTHAADDRTQAVEDLDQAADKAAEQDRALDGLRTSLESRLLIGQAQGLLMARHHVSSQASFALLTRLAHDSKSKLLDIAALLVGEADAGLE